MTENPKPDPEEVGYVEHPRRARRWWEVDHNQAPAELEWAAEDKMDEERLERRGGE